MDNIHSYTQYSKSIFYFCAFITLANMKHCLVSHVTNKLSRLRTFRWSFVDNFPREARLIAEFTQTCITFEGSWDALSHITIAWNKPAEFLKNYSQVCASMENGIFPNLKDFLLYCGIKIKEMVVAKIRQNTNVLTTSFRRDLMLTFWPLSPLPPVSGAFFFIFFTVSCPSFWL